MAPRHSRDMQPLGTEVLSRTRSIERLGKLVDLGSSQLRQIGAIGALGAEAPRHRFRRKTKVLDEMKASSRRRVHQDKGPR